MNDWYLDRAVLTGLVGGLIGVVGGSTFLLWLLLPSWFLLLSAVMLYVIGMTRKNKNVSE